MTSFQPQTSAQILHNSWQSNTAKISGPAEEEAEQIAKGSDAVVYPELLQVLIVAVSGKKCEWMFKWCLQSTPLPPPLPAVFYSLYFIQE